MRPLREAPEKGEFAVTPLVVRDARDRGRGGYVRSRDRRYPPLVMV
jgi:hypothetical protein